MRWVGFTRNDEWQLRGRIIEAQKGKGIVVALEGVRGERIHCRPH